MPLMNVCTTRLSSRTSSHSNNGAKHIASSCLSAGATNGDACTPCTNRTSSIRETSWIPSVGINSMVAQEVSLICHPKIRDDSCERGTASLTRLALLVRRPMGGDGAAPLGGLERDLPAIAGVGTGPDIG